MSRHIDYALPVTDGDTAVAIVYRLTDADGAVWRSSPMLKADALKFAETPVNAAGQWLVVPTLRHLMEGTTAQIEVYLGQVDLQLFYVLENDTSVDFVAWSPNATFYDANGGTMPTIEEAIALAGTGEVLYTTGGALSNMPPPPARALYVWRNRAFCANGNAIYPSQEFATGLGVQWNETLRSEWADGTGGITAICHLDWNYLAIFKRDAIAILSGPGPDGLGHGNYIVQTLSTKAGCVNVKSLVNGADGCYFQDAQTGRLMLLSPDLQIRECAAGAFDLSAYDVSGALHVEASRQVWFMVADQDSIIVLDYKHRTESAPMGSVYQWTLPDWEPVGATIRAGAPELLLETGNIAAQVAGSVCDTEADATTNPIKMDFITGDISPIGLQRQFNCSRLQFLGEYLGTHVLKLTTYPNFSTSGTTATTTVIAGPEQFVTRPPGMMRAQAVRVKVAEDTYNSANVLVSITTTGGYVVELGGGTGSFTLTLTMSDGTTQTAPVAATSWLGTGDGYTVEKIAIAGIPPDLTITGATLTVSAPYTRVGISSAVVSVRRDGGTAGEIFSGKSVTTATTYTSGVLALASSLGLTPELNAGFKFVGLALEVQDCGKIANLDVGRII